jgi:hypothetical protein
VAVPPSLNVTFTVHKTGPAAAAKDRAQITDNN